MNQRIAAIYSWLLMKKSAYIHTFKYALFIYDNKEIPSMMIWPHKILQNFPLQRISQMAITFVRNSLSFNNIKR